MTSPVAQWPNTAPVQLLAGIVQEVKIRCQSTIEIVKMDDIDEPVWVRFDSKDPIPMVMGSFVVFDSREFNVNRRGVTVRLRCEVDCKVNVEGATF